MSALSHIAKILFIILASVSCYTASTPGIPGKKKSNSEQLRINAQIVVRNKEVNGNFKMEVLFFDSVISVFTVKNNKPVTMLLKKDAPYMLKISKKGFVPRYVCLNTNIHDTGIPTDNYAFYLETDFIKNTTAMRLDNEALEMPIALVGYDKQTRNFNFNRDYTAFVSQRISAGLTENPFNSQD